MPLSVAEKIRDLIISRIAPAAEASRSHQAYRFVNWLEGELRKHVWKVYSEKYVPEDERSKWWKGVFPKRVVDNITGTREASSRIRLGASDRPLDYADFDDLFACMEKEWSGFCPDGPVNLQVARGHFEYVKHFRNALAHSRRLTHSDILLLQRNAQRFLSLVGCSHVVNEGLFVADKVL